MFKFVLLSATVFGAFASVSAQAMETRCYNDTFDMHANVTITKKIAHSVFGDYYVLKLKLKTDSPSFPGGSGTSSTTEGDTLYFRAGDGNQTLRSIADASVFSHGRGRISYIVSGKNKGYRRVTFRCN